MIELRSGDYFAGCKIISVCGKGGYGTVYLAEDAAGNRVAVKIINTTDKEQELKGIRNYMPVSHKSPYLLSVFHVGVEQNELFLVMEAADCLADSQYYLPDTLAKRLQLSGRITPAEALDIIQKIASAVKELHTAKLIHRDIKPDNVIFVNGQPKLSDPGLICSVERSITLAGTLGFLPPECFYGTESNSTQSDIYALGKLFYCLVTGEAPGRFPYLPRDLSFPLCRKLLPVLMKSCNSKKKKRYNTIDELQHDLPRKLPRPGIFLRLSESFRVWRLIHCYLWNFLLLTFFAGCVIFGLVYWNHQKNEAARQAELAALTVEKNKFVHDLSSGRKFLPLELDNLLGEEASRKLMKKFSTLPADPVQAVKLCRQYRQKLNDLAMQAAERNKKIPDAMKRAAAKRAFFHSSLGKFLNEKQKEMLKKELLQDEKDNRHILGNHLQLEKTFFSDSSRIFSFSYIPPGDFISPYSGKKKRIDYPFWVAPERLTVRQFSRMCRFQPPQSKNQEDTAVRFLWNDLLLGCRNSFLMFQIDAPFPPGYIVRPLTADEWDYCAFRGGDAPEGKPNALGLYGMRSHFSEIISSGQHKYRDSVLARHWKDKVIQREFVFFQSFLATTGTRIAIAPGDKNFYQEKLITGTPQTFEHNGKHYEFFGHLCANFKRTEAEKICRLLGGRLASLDSPELLQKTQRAASPIVNYHICVAADFKDGQWRWSSGKPVENAPPPPKDGEHFIMSGKRFVLKTATRYLGFVCEWTEAEFQARKNLRRQPIKWPKNMMRAFEVDGRQYVLFRIFLNYPHLCRRYAEILGGRLAEPETPELQKKISEEIKDFNDRQTLLGGYKHHERYYWYTSRNEITEPLALLGQVIDTAPSLSTPALQNGKLCAIQLPEQFLVEFPSPNSNQQ